MSRRAILARPMWRVSKVKVVGTYASGRPMRMPDIEYFDDEILAHLSWAWTSITTEDDATLEYRAPGSSKYRVIREVRA